MAWLLRPRGEEAEQAAPTVYSAVSLLSALIAAELNCEAHGKEVDFTGSEEVGKDGEPKEGAGGACGAVESPIPRVDKPNDAGAAPGPGAGNSACAPPCAMLPPAAL